MWHQRVEEIWLIISSGGPVMIPLFLLAILLYWNAFGLLTYIVGLNVRKSIHDPSADATRSNIVEFRERLNNHIGTQLKYAKVLIVAAPLLGLLGTVIGMLNTFKGIGLDVGDDTTKAVADGVKVALVTTQTGLMIAIIGLLITQAISRLHRSKDLQLIDIELETLKRRHCQ